MVNKNTTVTSLYLGIKKRLAASIPIINVMPPIVGVPVFFKCACGPSSLTICPNFSLCKIGIKNGHTAAVTKKLISNAINVSLNIISPNLYSPSPAGAPGKSFFPSFGITSSVE